MTRATPALRTLCSKGRKTFGGACRSSTHAVNCALPSVQTSRPWQSTCVCAFIHPSDFASSRHLSAYSCGILIPQGCCLRCNGRAGAGHQSIFSCSYPATRCLLWRCHSGSFGDTLGWEAQSQRFCRRYQHIRQAPMSWRSLPPKADIAKHGLQVD